MRTSILLGEPDDSLAQYVASCPEFSRDRIHTFRDLFVDHVKEEGHDAICGLALAIEALQAEGTGSFMGRNQPHKMDQILEALGLLSTSEISQSTIAAFQLILVQDFETGMEALHAFIRRKAQGN